MQASRLVLETSLLLSNRSDMLVINIARGLQLIDVAVVGHAGKYLGKWYQIGEFKGVKWT